MDTDAGRCLSLVHMMVIGITGLLFYGCVESLQFDSNPQYVQFPENKSTPIGTLLFLLRATDSSDPLSEMTIFTNDAETSFYVNILQLSKTNPALANITLKNELDRESNMAGIDLKFHLLDQRGNMIPKSVRVYILDVCDEAPMFDRPSYTLEIDEIDISSARLVFSEIHATDNDSGNYAVVTYSMESSYLAALYNETFRIDPMNGSIYLLRSLDYENNSFYHFTIYSHDTCNLTANPADLLVIVRDVQDTPPSFVGLPYRISIPQGYYSNVFALRVTAIDGDIDIPNPISYIFIQSDRFCQEHFVLNATTGEIVINGRLDWETDEMKHINGVCNFIVQAKEIDKHPENQRGQTVANVTVTVIILQLNTQAPQINRTTTNNVQTDETAQNTTNPVITTIFPSSSSTASTSMVPTSQRPPSYVPDPVRTTIFPSSSSTASTSMVPTSQLPPSYVPDPGEYELHLEFDLKAEMLYNETYKDKTSPQFQSLAKSFSISLTEVFKNIEGFKSIEILRFRSGSVHVDYLVNVFGTVDVATVTEEIRSNIVSNLTSIAGVPVNTAYTNQSMIRRLDSMRTKDKCSLASTYLCPFGYYCKPAIASTSIILCIDRCNSSVCQNNGECYIGHHSHDVQCRCGSSENVVYSGQRCEIKTGVVTVQERNLYLIIASAIVGGILLVFISTMCVINRKRNRLKKRLTISHVLQLDEMHKRSNNGVPAIDDRYVISLNPAVRRYPEGYCGGRVNVSYQDQGLDGGYLQARDCAKRNSDEDYDYIGPEFEVGSRSQHN